MDTDILNSQEVILIGRQNRKGSSGFTLIEALIAITILAFGLIAIVTMIDVAFSASSMSRNTTKATELATWMMDRIRQETANVKQYYTTDISRLRSFDNDASVKIRVDTDLAADPASEPGKTAVNEWRSLIKGSAIANYLGASQLTGDRLPQGAHGTVLITPYDVAHGGQHFIVIEILWQKTALVVHRVHFESVLASSE